MFGSCCSHGGLLAPSTPYCSRRQSSIGTSTSAPAPQSWATSTQSLHQRPADSLSASYRASWQPAAPIYPAQRLSRRRTGTVLRLSVTAWSQTTRDPDPAAVLSPCGVRLSFSGCLCVAL